jgi:hypothetical protein
LILNEAMTLERIQSLYRAQPFRAFTLHLADGRDVTVKSPEFMSFSPTGRTIAVHEADESLRIIDLLLVTEAHVPSNGNGSATRRARRRR